jgi:hypothetical protein
MVLDAAVRHDEHLAVARAVVDVTAQRAVFSIDHLELALGRILHINPADTVAGDWLRVQRLAARAVNTTAAGLRLLSPPALMTWGPSLLRGSDREPVYGRHRDWKLTAEPVLAAEHQVIGYATRRGATPAPVALLDNVAHDVDLSAEKRAALHHMVGDDRRVTGIVGPAGTGKTYLQRAVGLAAQRAGIPVLGLTVGQNAAEVLADATREGGAPGIRTENIAMWLHAQHTPPADSAPGQWDFQPGQWVIIDEASQASSYDLARLVQLLDPVGGKLILVGDPAQISAVGPGGLFRYLSALGTTTELAEVRRFTQPWEGPASLRLRDGDTTVLAEYDRRGRITSGHRDDLAATMLDGWAADTLAGHESLLLVETEAEAALLAAAARSILIAAGVVAPDHSVRLADGTDASVGDVIVTRRNDRTLTAGTKFVANRDRWRVLNIGPHGQLQVVNTRTRHTLTLPAEYVAQDVQLAYAATVDSAQGRTVDIARALIDQATIRSRLYVMATRGRLINWLHVVTEDHPPEGHPPQPPGAGIAVLADILRRDDTERSATETEQTLWADVDALHQWGPIYDDLTAHAHTDHYVAVVRSVAGSKVANRLASDPAMPALAHRLNALSYAGYDPAQVLSAATGQRELSTARDVAAVLAWRIDGLHAHIVPDPQVATSPQHSASFTQRAPRVSGDIGKALVKVAQICDSRVHGLAQLAADQQPAWSTALGPVPNDETGRRLWLARAEVVVTYRDRYQITGNEPIGPQPSPRDPAHWAAWQRAHTVLGIATLAGQIAHASHTQLQDLIAAQRATDATAPPYVGGPLRTAHVDLVAAQQHVRELQLQLAAAQADAIKAAMLTAARIPRSWQAGPVQARATAEHATAQRAELRANNRAEKLTDRLAGERLTACQDTANGLEQQHQIWSRWYEHALPTRYAGLAAAHEQAQRARRRTDDLERLLNAVRDTAARIRAVDDTLPRPHARLVPDRLTDNADASRDRIAQTAAANLDDIDPADFSDEPELDGL